MDFFRYGLLYANNPHHAIIDSMIKFYLIDMDPRKPK